MADTSWTNNPKIKNIDPRKLTILMELVKETEGKTLEQNMPILMNAQKRLKSQNLEFTKDENDVLMEILTKNLSKKEKMQLEFAKKMMANRK